MVKDAKYIIKRILIGVVIALILAYLKGGLLLNAHALEVSNYGIGYTNVVIDNTTFDYVKSISGNPWSVYSGTSGYINGTFTLQKVNGTSTSINIFPLQVYVRTNTAYSDYPCNIGSVMNSNSTFNGGSFSFKCPIKMGSSGVTALVFNFQDIQTNFPSDYRLSIGSLLSYEVSENVNFNVDTSGTTNAINNQINNDNQNTQDIINNQNSNKQDIINNQNSNTEKEIESQKVCKTLLINQNTNFAFPNSYLDNSGNVNSTNESYGVTDYYLIGDNSSLVLTKKSIPGGRRFCFYDNNKDYISCYQGNQFDNGTSITIPTNAKYIRFTIDQTADAPNFEFYTCQNGNQAIVNSQQDINNTLNDTSGGEVSSSWFDDFRDNSNSPVSDLLTMPITLLQAYLDGFSGNCQAMNLGQLYGTYIIIPCLNLRSFLGDDLWALIDVLFTIFMVYNIAMLCVSIYEGITSLHDDMQFLYSPRHAGGGDTRVERYGDEY